MQLITIKKLFCPTRGNLFHLSPNSWDAHEKLTPEDPFIKNKSKMPCLVWTTIEPLGNRTFQLNSTNVVGR